MQLLMIFHMLIACYLLVTCGAASSDIIDTAEPIIRTVSEQDQYAYFGYSVVLHQTLANPTSMQQSLDNSWMIVGAPNGTAASGAVDNVGVVYRCPVARGSCEPLLGDGSGPDRRLYDTDANGGDEDKEDQFMGGTLASNGDRFVACAHRYVKLRNFNIVYAYPLGRCVFSGRSLSGFTNYEPCDVNIGNLLFVGNAGVCQAGTSAAIADDPDSGQPAMAIGAPGIFNWEGIPIRSSGSGETTYGPRSSGPFGYQSYAITSGLFLSSTRRDFAVSLPRSNIYRGAVNLVMNTAALTLVTQPELAGTQMGEYYGFSLVAANLNLDNRDELLVAAPMYTANGINAETGRVFIYNNIGGSLQQSSIIVGFEAYSRFGYAMANLGDITGDSRDDIAISAPFGSAGGTVYIFHSSSSQLLNPVPQQIITGSVLATSFPGIADLRGFGTSLASGVDVDGNTQMDLAIGAFDSQHVILLRSRPLAQVSTSITSDSFIVNVEERFCSFEGSSELYACFNLSACAMYRGDGVRDTLNLTFSLFADRARNVSEQRIFFSNSQNTISRTESYEINDMRCLDFTAFITRNIIDRFNGFVIELEVAIPTADIPPSEGNPDPTDFSGFPVVASSGVGQVRVETFKDCNGDTCIPDLVITVDDPRYITAAGSTDALTVGSVTSVGVDINVLNRLDDAFQAVLTFAIPTNSLELDRVRNVTGTTQLSIACDSIPVADEATSTEYTQYTCIIGNPISDGRMLDISVVLRPRTGLSGSAADIALNFSVNSVNPENASTIDDGSNWEVVSLEVNAAADAYLGNPGLVEPREVFYASQAPDFEGAPQNVSQLGANVITSFVVRNSGPSTIPEVQLTVWWPLNSTESAQEERMGTFLFYPAQITAISSGATVSCESTYINPEGSDTTYLLPSDSEFETESQGATGSGGGGGRRRRKRRSLHARKFIKRQEAAASDGEAMMVQAQDIIQTCLSDPGTLNCVPINCTILQLRGGDSAQLDISSYVDDRFFAGQVDRYFISPTASVSIVNGDFIDTPDDGQGESRSSTATAEIRLFPANASVVNRRVPVPAWVIVVSVIAALIVIAVIAATLWGLGFFRRKHKNVLEITPEE